MIHLQPGKEPGYRQWGAIVKKKLFVERGGRHCWNCFKFSYLRRVFFFNLAGHSPCQPRYIVLPVFTAQLLELKLPLKVSCCNNQNKINLTIDYYSNHSNKSVFLTKLFVEITRIFWAWYGSVFGCGKYAHKCPNAPLYNQQKEKLQIKGDRLPWLQVIKLR